MLRLYFTVYPSSRHNTDTVTFTPSAPSPPSPAPAPSSPLGAAPGAGILLDHHASQGKLWVPSGVQMLYISLGENSHDTIGRTRVSILLL